MYVLVMNPGSSSIKFSMFAEAGDGPRSVYEGELSGIGGGEAKLEFADAAGKDLAGALGEVKAASMAEAMATVERAVGIAGQPAPDGVGYRVVHPGATLKGHQRITPEVLAALKEAVAFAPLHDPAAIEMIEEIMRRLPGIPHYACFDTVFPRDDAGGGVCLSLAAEFAGARCAAVWVPWAVVRVGGVADAWGSGGGLSEDDADCAPGEWVQRDGGGGLASRWIRRWG